MRLLRLFKNDLAKEISEWVADGTISTEQAEQIGYRYGIDFHSDSGPSLSYTLLIGLGYLFIGLALITLLSANWDDIPRAVRMGGLLLITSATQLTALNYFHNGFQDKARALFFLGNFFYGASIILIAQIYHLGEHMPDGIFWWALGCLPTALLLQSRLLLLQTLALAYIWFFVEAGMGFYPSLFPLFIIAAAYILYRSETSALLFLATIGAIGLWLEYSLAYWWGQQRGFDFEAEHFAISIALFILAYSYSHWLDAKGDHRSKDYGALLSIWSLRFCLICLFVLSFDEPWRKLIRADWQHTGSMLIIITALLGGAAALSYRGKRFFTILTISVIYLLALAVPLLSDAKEHGTSLQILTNLVLIGLGIRLIIRGTQAGISHYFFLGLVTILLTAFIRYLDLIGNYIGGAILFIVFAAILLGAAKYWRHQQQLSSEGSV